MDTKLGHHWQVWRIRGGKSQQIITEDYSYADAENVFRSISTENKNARPERIDYLGCIYREMAAAERQSG